MIRVIGGDPHRLSGLGPSKVVHVRVIEQKGNAVVIEMNGIRMNARMDEGLPQNFLAFIENTGNTVQLKLLKNVQSSEGFKQLTRQKLVEKIESFFLSNNIPFSQSLLKMALRFTESGLKLDKTLLNTLHRISLSLGEDFAAFLINLASQGIELNRELIHFFYQFRNTLRKLLKDKGSEASTDSQEDRPHPSDLLIGLMSSLFDTRYDAKLRECDQGELLIQVVRRDEEGIQRFYIDISLNDEDKLLIVIDWGETLLKANVLMSQELYNGIITELNIKKDTLLDKIRNITRDKELTLDFHPMERDIHLFELDNTITRSGFASNLDIFV